MDRPEEISLSQARERFPDLEKVNWMLDRVDEPIPVWTDVHQDADSIKALGLHDIRENTTNLTIVDGDLSLDRDLYFDDNELIHCTGNARVERLEMSYVCGLVVSGSLVARDVYVHHGDDGGALIVGGDLQCATFVAATYFVAEVEGALKAGRVFVDSSYAKDIAEKHGLTAVSIDDHELFVAEVLDDDGRVDCDRMLARINDGLPPLRVIA